VVRVIGIGDTNPAAESAVEAFEATGSAQVFAVPGRELLLQMVVGDSRAEVTTQGGDRFRLGMAIFAHDLEIATESDVVATGFPDEAEVLENDFVASTALLGGEILWRAEGLVDVAQFVEEATLQVRIKPNGLQGRAESCTSITDDEFQTVLSADALCFQDPEETDPILGTLA